MWKQIGALRGYLFRAYDIKGVSQHYLYLAETQKQAEECESFIVGEREGSRCTMIGACLHMEVGASYVIG